jgi:activator of HSP90 ATPase
MGDQGTAAFNRRQIVFAASVALFGWATFSNDAFAEIPDGISRTAESIHQEPDFRADPKKVYETLTDRAQFHKVVLLGEAARTGKIPANHPTRIGIQAGEPFSLFGGFITGRHIELVPNERIIQAWREESWDPGVFSIVRFDLKPSGSGTHLVFDHTGFPPGNADHLAKGWKDNYWLPLAQVLETTAP